MRVETKNAVRMKSAARKLGDRKNATAGIRPERIAEKVGLGKSEIGLQRLDAQRLDAPQKLDAMETVVANGVRKVGLDSPRIGVARCRTFGDLADHQRNGDENDRHQAAPTANRRVAAVSISDSHAWNEKSQPYAETSKRCGEETHLNLRDVADFHRSDLMASDGHHFLEDPISGPQQNADQTAPGLTHLAMATAIAALMVPIDHVMVIVPARDSRLLAIAAIGRKGVDRMADPVMDAAPTGRREGTARAPMAPIDLEMEIVPVRVSRLLVIAMVVRTDVVRMADPVMDADPMARQEGMARDPMVPIVCVMAIVPVPDSRLLVIAMVGRTDTVRMAAPVKDADLMARQEGMARDPMAIAPTDGGLTAAQAVIVVPMDRHEHNGMIPIRSCPHSLRHWAHDSDFLPQGRESFSSHGESSAV